MGDFYGPVAENPPSNSGDASLISGWETKILHALGQPSHVATITAGATCCNYRALMLWCPHSHRQKPARHHADPTRPNQGSTQPKTNKHLKFQWDFNSTGISRRNSLLQLNMKEAHAIHEVA